MSRVGIIMSTYNGGEYVEKQLESIYKQTFKDFTLYVRDDGSDKEFVQELLVLQKKYGFILKLGENVGFLNSFMKMLSETNEQIIAFSDQDDVWLPHKLEKAVSWFDNNWDEENPLLFHSAYDCVDAEGQQLDRFYFPDINYDFRRSITENHYSGFSMLINARLKELMLLGNCKQIDYHDWWAAMIVHAFGIAHSDREVCALHRVHGDNVTTFNIKTRIAWLRQSLKTDTGIHMRVMEFERCFGERLDEGNKEILDMFVFSRYDFKKSLKKCFYPKRWRPIMSSEIVQRFLMLIGKI